MNIVEMLNAIKNDEAAQDVFADILADLIIKNSEVQKALSDFVSNDIDFSLDCSEIYDYYYTGQNISLTVNGRRVAETSFSISKKY